MGRLAMKRQFISISSKKKLIARNTGTDIGARETIISALMSLNVPKKVGADFIMIRCPFHDDNTPSCGIFTSVGMEIPLGFFHCLGCSAKGGWNKLAKQLSLPEIKDWQAVESTINDKIHTDEDEQKFFGVGYTLKQLLQNIGSPQTIPWPKQQSWRGYDGEIIQALGGLYVVDNRSEELMLFFPVKVGDKYYGGVKAYIGEVNGLKYITTKGEWVKDYGLLGLEYSKKLIKKYKAIVLVEGPRDVLRLLKAGIPAVAILGSQNFSKKKAMAIFNVGEIQNLYVLPDNDRAGKLMAKNVKRIVEDLGLAKVKYLKLPVEYDEKGKLIKMDPDNAPKSIIKQIKKVICG